MNFDIEKEVMAEGYKVVCGVDEAGRGPLCGPVCAAAVILPVDCEIEGINDSKKLSEKKRDALYDIIKEKAIAQIRARLIFFMFIYPFGFGIFQL